MGNFITIFVVRLVSERKKMVEFLFKVLVIGDIGVGKTSLIKRYVHHIFGQTYKPTIGVDFALKVINWDPEPLIRLQLWDIAGQERFGTMTRVCYRDAVAALIVFDISRQTTFEAVSKWKQDLDSKVMLADGSPVPCILLANKCDSVDPEELEKKKAMLDEFVSEKGFTGWYQTSAKENINIDEATSRLITTVIENEGRLAPPRIDTEIVDISQSPKQKEKSCCD